jgi:hypothetical protein
MQKRILLIIGVLLIALSIAGLVAGRISYATHEDVMKVGPMQATVETRRVITIPPVLSALVLVSGILVVYLGWKKT